MGTCLFCSLLHSQLLGNYLLHSMSELAWTHESCKLQCCKHISCKVVKAFQKNPQSWYLRIKAEWVGDKLCFSFYPNVCAELLSCVWLFVAHGWWPARFLCPWNFSMQEYWSGWSLTTPGDLPDPGIKPTYLESPALADRFFTSPTWEALMSWLNFTWEILILTSLPMF